jgi:hypothetical protein
MILGTVAGKRRSDGDFLYGDVLLLLDATGRADASAIVDESMLVRPLTPVGNAAILNQQFELDGTEDWILLADSLDWRFNNGVNLDFTIELFNVIFDTAAVDTNGNGQPLVTKYDAFSPQTNQREWAFFVSAANISFNVSTAGTSVDVNPTTAWSPVLGTPYDITVTREGTVYRIFVDGVQVTTLTNAGVIFNGTSPVTIGGRNTRATSAADRDDFDGRFKAIRITQWCRYFGNYTVPNLPLPTRRPTEVDALYGNVQAHLHFEGSDASLNIRDRKGRVWTLLGAAQLDTAQFQFGVSSLLLNGTTSYISTVDAANIELGAGNFTIECWVRAASFPNSFNGICAKWGAAASRSWDLGVRASTGELEFFYTTDGTANLSTVGTGTTLAINTWYHVAVSRDGANLRLFVNGTQVNTTHNIAALVIHNNAAAMLVGRGSTASAEYWSGHIDEFRMTVGAARYTANFTPRTEAFPEFIDDTFNPDDIGPTLTFSNGNKTISRNVGSNDSPNYANASRSRRARSTGKIYVEATMNRDGSQWSGIFGICRASAALTLTTLTGEGNPLALDLIRMLPSGGGGVTTIRVYNQNTTQVNYTPEGAALSVSGMAVDFDAGKIWFRNTGVWLLGSLAGGAGNSTFDEDDPTFTFTPGVLWRIYGESPFSLTDITLNIGPTFSGSVPAGFGYW